MEFNELDYISRFVFHNSEGPSEDINFLRELLPAQHMHFFNRSIRLLSQENRIRGKKKGKDTANFQIKYGTLSYISIYVSF